MAACLGHPSTCFTVISSGVRPLNACTITSGRSNACARMKCQYLCYRKSRRVCTPRNGLDQDSWDVQTDHTRTSRRQLFTFADWNKHRSGTRYLRHLSTFPSSGVVRGLVKPVTCVFLMTTIAATYCSSFTSGILPAWVPPPPTIAIEPFQLTSFALSLLLVFRTNSSYSRFEEARRKFGSLITTSRDLTRQCLCWIPEHRIELRSLICRWLCALAISAMCHLRPEKEHNLRQELAPVLPPDELELLASSFHKPNYCLLVLTKTIATSGIHQDMVQRADENLSELTRSLTACERILNTPIPMSYTRHTARFLIGWLFLLPWALWRYCHWAMVPVSVLVSFVLLGIEEIGVYIEEPFSILPLERFCLKLRKIVAAYNQEYGQLDTIMRPIVNETGAQAGEAYARDGGACSDAHLSQPSGTVAQPA